MGKSVYKQPFLKQQAEYLRTAWNEFADLNPKKAISALVSLGGNTIYFGINGLSTVMRSELGRDSLKTSEKILPNILLMASIPLTVTAALVTVLGVSILIPPFTFAASAAGVMRSVSSYIKDKKSLDNLNNKLITIDQINESITKSKLSSDEREVIRAYIEQPKNIYEGLYQLRQDIIKDEQLTSAQKNAIVQQIHDKIEDCYQGRFSRIDITLEDMPDEVKNNIEAKITKLNQNIKNYNQTEESYTQLDIPKRLKKKVMNFKATHEHIYAQDIPSITKSKMIEMMASPKLKKASIDSINAQLANHFINQQSKAQQVMLDQSFTRFIHDKYPSLTINDIGYHLESPRMIYKQIEKIHQKVPLECRADFKKEILEEIERKSSLPNLSIMNEESVIVSMIESFCNKNNIPISMASDELGKITSIQNRQKYLEEHISRTVDMSDMQAINAHRQHLLIQHIDNRGIEINPPNVCDDLFLNRASEQKILPKHVQERVTDIKEKVTKPIVSSFSAMKKKCQSKIYGKEKADEIDHAMKERDVVRTEFRQQFSGSHKLLKQVQERNFLKKAVPRRILGVGLSLSNMVLSGIATFALPAIFTPAAPVGAAVSVGVGALSGAVTVASVANSVTLMAEHGFAYQKVKGAKEAAFEGVNPDVGQEKKDLDALKETLSTSDKKERVLSGESVHTKSQQSKSLVFNFETQHRAASEDKSSEPEREMKRSRKRTFR